MDSRQEQTLLAMMDDVSRLSELYGPSPFWRRLMDEHVERLRAWGFAHFKRTVNTQYFNWSIKELLGHMYLPQAALWWARHPTLDIATARFPNAASPSGPNIRSFDPVSARIYATYVAMLVERVRADDRHGLIDRLSEPRVGNPFAIEYRGHETSQDLANSIHELYAATRGTGEPRHVAELGAGYGRLGYVFLEALPATRYCVIDIPPALFLAQEYLSAVFPEAKVFKYRRFERFDDVREEFAAARIQFLMADQIELIPEGTFDLAVNISSLNEMTHAQVANYLAQLDRVTSGYFYTKQWFRSRTPENGVVLRPDNYPYPRRWSRMYQGRHPLQIRFFHALYRTR